MKDKPLEEFLEELCALFANGSKSEELKILLAQRTLAYMNARAAILNQQAANKSAKVAICSTVLSLVSILIACFSWLRPVAQPQPDGLRANESTPQSTGAQIPSKPSGPPKSEPTNTIKPAPPSAPPEAYKETPGKASGQAAKTSGKPPNATSSK